MRCKVHTSWPPASRGHAVPFPPASMIKGSLTPTPPFLRGGFRFIARCLRFVCPRRQQHREKKNTRTTACVYRRHEGHSFIARPPGGERPGVSLDTRYPRTQPVFPSDIAIPAHIPAGTCASKRGCSHMSDRCQPRGVGVMKSTVIDRPKSHNDLDLQGGRAKKIKTQRSDHQMRWRGSPSGICKSAAVSSSHDSRSQPAARSWAAPHHPSHAKRAGREPRRGAVWFLICQSQVIYRHKLPEPLLPPRPKPYL